MHTITHEHSGKRESHLIVPVCACGWRGQGAYAWNDYQQAVVADQAQQHLRSVQEEACS